MDKQAVLDKITEYSYNMARLAELKERLDSINYKTTATYGNLAPSTGSGFNSSKVEDMGNRRHEIELAMQPYKRKIAEVRRMIEKSGLTDVEKGVMWWLSRNGKLQAFARREHIGKDNIYKIRDRAVSKIIAAQKPQNVE